MTNRLKNLFKMHKFRTVINTHDGHEVSKYKVHSGTVKADLDYALFELSMGGKIGDEITVKIVKVK